MKHFAANLKRIRKSKGLSQNALAFRINFEIEMDSRPADEKPKQFSASQICHYESGERIPDTMQSFLLANALGCTVNDFIYGVGDQGFLPYGDVASLAMA